MATWRLIMDKAHDGAQNMAIDHAIMEAVAAGHVLPTLRLYAWEPACLSLGYNQSSDEVDVDAATSYEWQLVRRATGGKAILHTDELTYSVALPEDSPVITSDIVESYRRLSAALMQAMNIIGASTESLPVDTPLRQNGPVCFEVPSNYEITADGKKLVGSAQVRRKKAVLQHGSLPLYGDIARICDVLKFATDSARATARHRVYERATTLSDALGYHIGWQSVADAIADGFSQTFNLDFEPGTLSSDERAHADILSEQTYTSNAWTHRR